MGKSLYYRIGQACKEVDIQPYVLRYWETEFAVLAPEKSKSGQRVYSAEDLTIIRRIKELLYDEGFTIVGAKKKLDAELASDGGPKTRTASKAGAEPAGKAKDETPAPLDTAATEQVETLRQSLRDALDQSRDILRLLDGKPAKKTRK